MESNFRVSSNRDPVLPFISSPLDSLVSMLKRKKKKEKEREKKKEGRRGRDGDDSLEGKEEGKKEIRGEDGKR